MTILGGNVIFQFTVLNVSDLKRCVFSPPIATSSDMFWELEFTPSSEHDEDHCALFLSAIPNPEESKSLQWPSRSMFSATIFVKDPQTNDDIERRAIEHEFSPKAPSWGYFQFFKKKLIPPSDSVIIGVEFEKCEISTVAVVQPFPNRQIPEDLIDAWNEQVDNTETSNIRFNINGHFIYANSAILSRRNKYFAYLLEEGEWARPLPGRRVSLRGETSQRILDQTFSTLNSRYKYCVEITEFHHETFLEMLRFVYTDQVSFDDDKEYHKTPFDMFAIADKYFMTDLRQRAKMDVWENLSVENAAEVLFGEAYKWGDMKVDVIKYVVENFNRVKETEGFKKILLNPQAYPMFSEVWMEVLELVK